ncbi:hypothetical protein IX51_03970 [uncultured archaeon]|nr:hypothetical protein IX51_03970 [uncultured archaeon]
MWTEEKLEMIADARRVLGYAGTFVNYKALANKFLLASTFEEALELRPIVNKKAGEAIPLSY